ncbi:hypothetical protein [Actinomadura sp. WAC 06369]|nr:hypothetical protein [Actinomadura sp. WAC 06369]
MIGCIEYDRDALAAATGRVVALAEAEDLPAPSPPSRSTAPTWCS